MRRGYLNSIKNRDEILSFTSFKVGNGEHKTRICPINMPNEHLSKVTNGLQTLHIGPQNIERAIKFVIYKYLFWCNYEIRISF